MDFFGYRDGVYHAEDVPLPVLAAAVGTPFYCYSHATLARHYTVFAESLASLSPKICFAVKANGNVAVLAALARLGAGADVVSMGEIMLARRAGILPENIVFSGVGKTAEEMAHALREGIFQFNVESEPELRLLSHVADSLGARARIALRVNPDVTPGTHAKISTGQKESKFGVPMRQAADLYSLARGLPGVEVQGVSVHIGSQLTDLTPFAEAFSRVRSLVEELRAAGHPIRTVDFGGGLGIPYGREDPPLPSAYAQVVKNAVAGLEAEYIFEPGRVLVGNAGILVSRVIYVKEPPAGGGKRFVILDAGMNDLIRPTLYEAHHEIIPALAPTGDAREADVVGPVCETGDSFAEGRLLPPVSAGDLLVIRSAGAYGAAMACTYNARPLIAEVMVKGAEHAVVRPRQSYAELVGQGAVPEWV